MLTATKLRLPKGSPSPSRSIFLTKTLLPVPAMLCGFLIAFLFSQSLSIAIAFGAFIGIFSTIAQKRNESKKTLAIQSACPEMIDLLISGVQSGLSINESLANLAERGPEVLRPYFHTFRENLYARGDFRQALVDIKESLAEPQIDQIVEALLISKELGGAELLNILRLLGNFIREDLTLRREIAVKHSWIKNSAHLSAAAPWLLLLLLSTQPATAQAFSTSTGAGILATGLGMTAIAYLWMNQLSRLPQGNRIFTESKARERA
jgi:tight adherence protein B